ncbi:MAG: DUF1698 domain-containing protein, partial [Desulfobacterales bacterium]|nr:DUF1698 domain-containing protein [Desulfobacterales bacterium]
MAHNFTNDTFAPHGPVLAALARRCEDRLAGDGGKAETFRQLLRNLPTVSPSDVDLDARQVRVGKGTDLDGAETDNLDQVLKGLHPWRKGPFDLFGTRVDCEWRSDLKWNRVKNQIKPLADRKILDIGSSSGYYLFRMVSAAPRLALGLEPYLTFYYQFRALQHYLCLPHIYSLPVRFDEFPVLDGFFDTVFCMGILYHSRAPLDMLGRIRRQLAR